MERKKERGEGEATEEHRRGWTGRSRREKGLHQAHSGSQLALPGFLPRPRRGLRPGGRRWTTCFPLSDGLWSLSWSKMSYTGHLKPQGPQWRPEITQVAKSISRVKKGNCCSLESVGRNVFSEGTAWCGGSGCLCWPMLRHPFPVRYQPQMV